MGTCRFEGCGRETEARGLCHSHSTQYYRGRPLTPLRPLHQVRPLAERLHAKTEASGDCLIWTGGRSDSGYGHVWTGTRTQLVHRAAYELAKGPIQKGLHIDHLCRNRLCVNPDHLEAVTQQENNRREAAARTCGATYSPEGNENS